MTDSASLVMALGWLAVCLNIAGYFISNTKMMLRALALSEILWLLFHIFMNFWGAVITSTLTVVRNLLGSEAPLRVLRPSLLALLLLSAFTLWWHAAAWYTYLPILGLSFETIALWHRDNPLALRAGIALNECTWIVFGLAVSSWPNLACAVFGVTVLIYKIHNEHKKIKSRDLSLNTQSTLQ
jgi:hypothetical protein